MAVVRSTDQKINCVRVCIHYSQGALLEPCAVAYPAVSRSGVPTQARARQQQHASQQQPASLPYKAEACLLLQPNRWGYWRKLGQFNLQANYRAAKRCKTKKSLWHASQFYSSVCPCRPSNNPKEINLSIATRSSCSVVSTLTPPLNRLWASLRNRSCGHALMSGRLPVK